MILPAPKSHWLSSHLPAVRAGKASHFSAIKEQLTGSKTKIQPPQRHFTPRYKKETEEKKEEKAAALQPLHAWHHLCRKRETEPKGNISSTASWDHLNHFKARREPRTKSLLLEEDWWKHASLSLARVLHYHSGSGMASQPQPATSPPLCSQTAEKANADINPKERERY